MSKLSFCVTQHLENLRIDQLLARQCPQQSRSYYQHLLENNAVTVNKQKVNKRYKVKQKDLIEIELIALPEIKVRPENIPLDILFEDDSIIVINKSAQMCTHPAVGNTSNTVAGALCYHIKALSEFNDNLRPGIVHRLDKETSGVLIAAKTPRAHQILSDAFKNRLVKKTYLALCHSTPSALQADLPIFRDQAHRKRMAVNYIKGRASYTKFKVLEKNAHFSLVEAYPSTGRTHQIRVHLKALQSPIVGDKLYAKKIISQRQMLHAKRLTLNHPINNKSMTFTAPIANDFIENYEKLLQAEKNCSVI